MEEAGVHLAEGRGDAEGDVGLGEDVAVEFDARGNLGHGQTVGVEAEDAALGDEEDVLSPLGGHAAAEGDVLDCGDEFAILALLDDAELAVLDRQLQTTGGHVAAEDDVAGSGGDVDEAASAGGDVRPGGEAGDVDTAPRIDLEEGEEGAVEAAALEVDELLR